MLNSAVRRVTVTTTAGREIAAGEILEMIDCGDRPSEHWSVVGLKTTQPRFPLPPEEATPGAWEERINGLVRMRNSGLYVVGVAPFLRCGADYVVVPIASPIKTLGDLKGKKFGEFSRTSLNSVIEHAVAQKVYDLDLDKDAFVQESGMPLLIGLLDQGKLDASDVFNALEPGLVVAGKYRPLFKIIELVHQLGLFDTPYLLYGVANRYATAHPDNVRAFVAAYHEAIHILQTDDAVWLEEGQKLEMSDAASAMFRNDARNDLQSSFTPETEANIRKVFEFIMANAGEKALSFSQLPTGFLTLAYQ